MLTAHVSGKWAAMTTLCGFALIAAGGTAHAQAVDESARKSFAVRIGSYIPTEQDARRAGGTHNFSVEADWTLQRLPERSSVGVISLGFIEREKLRIIPFTLTQVFRDPGSNFFGKPYYYGLGIGLYTVRMQFPGTDDRIKHLFGGLVTVGVDLTPTIFIDAKYHYISKYDNKFVGGTLLSVGTRF
ncbi:MAG: hypothetical protein SFU56_19905 [Capsulimonadales bacterium]|nr:hypothetical protein [Capsulimonadales bacterium]